MNKKILIILYVLVVSLLFSCTKKSAESDDGVVTLNVWMNGNTDTIKAYYEEEKALLAEAYPNIKINVRLTAFEAFKTLIKTALASNDAPDVFFNWSFEYTYLFARSGLLYDLSEFKDNSYWGKMNHPSLSSFSIGDKIYGSPDHLIAKYFFYNKKFFADNNLSVPTTYDELVQLCDKIKKIDPDIIPIAFGNSEPWPGGHYIFTLNQKWVGEKQAEKDYYLQESDEKLFSDSGYVSAFQTLLDLQELGYFNKSPNSVTPDASIQYFRNGDAAMVYSGTWNIRDFEKDLPGNYGFFRFPAIAQGKGDQNYLFMLAEGMNVSSKTKHPKEVNQYLDFLLSSKVQVARADHLGFTPIAKINPEDVKGRIPQTLLDVSKDIQTASGQILLSLVLDPKLTDLYLKSTQEVLNKTKTPQEVMDEIRKTAVEIKNKK